MIESFGWVTQLGYERNAVVQLRNATLLNHLGIEQMLALRCLPS